MIVKASLIVLILISCCSLYLIDFFIKQEQEESSKQNREFFKQTRLAVQAKNEALQSYKIQIIIDFDRCRRNASLYKSGYLELIQKYLPKKHGQEKQDPNLNNEFDTLMNNQLAECKAIYEARLAGI